ncbi:MAG: ankyrin repeat domain-containing protein [Chlamydiales bacterium]
MESIYHIQKNPSILITSSLIQNPSSSQLLLNPEEPSRAGQRRLRTETNTPAKNIVPGDELLDILAGYANNPDKIPALHYAVKMGDENAVNILLKNGIDINKSCQAGTPLEIALKQNSISMAKLLMTSGAKINSISIDHAIRNKSIPALQLIKEFSGNSEFLYRHISLAIENNFNNGVDFVIKSGLNISKQDQLFEMTINTNNEEAVKIFLNSQYEIKTMHNGGQVLFNSLKDFKISSSLINTLIENDIPCNYSQINQNMPDPKTLNVIIKNENYPLITAAVERGDINIVSMLIDRGVPVDVSFIPKIIFSTNDPLGPLQDPKINRIINKGSGPRPSYTDIKFTLINNELIYNPLYRAVLDNRADIAKLLLKHGANMPFVTEKDFGTINASTPNEKQDWHNLIYFQQYVEQVQPPAIDRFGRLVPRPPTKVLLPKAFEQGIKDLNEKLQALSLNKKIQESTKKQGALLMTAIQNGNAELVGVLLDKGHPVNFVGDNGKMPIKLAVERGTREIISLLLKHGADWDGV